MSPTWILYPLFAMALLTLFVALRMLLLRIQSVRSGKLTVGYFRLNEGGEVPDDLARATQHYDNLFEMPVLFYLIVVVLFMTSSVNILFVILAWSYVGFRIAHAYVHMTYNNVIHRKNVFLLGTFVLYSMWFIWFGKMLFL